MQTPIEKAIAEFNRLKSESQSIHDLIYLDGVLAVLYTLLSYERQHLRHVADKAWDACEKFIYAEQQNDNYEALGRDERVEVINRQTYLKKTTRYERRTETGDKNRG